MPKKKCNRRLARGDRITHVTDSSSHLFEFLTRGENGRWRRNELIKNINCAEQKLVVPIVEGIVDRRCTSEGKKGTWRGVGKESGDRR